MSEEGNERKHKVNPVIGLLLFGAFALSIFVMAYQQIMEQKVLGYMYFFLVGICIILFGVLTLFDHLSYNVQGIILIAASFIFSLGGILWGISMVPDYSILALAMVGVFILFIVVIIKIMIPHSFEKDKSLIDVLEKNGVIPQWKKDQPWSSDLEEPSGRIIRMIYVKEKRELERHLKFEKITLFLLVPLLTVLFWPIISSNGLELFIIFLPGFCIIGIPLGLRFIIRRIRLVKDLRTGNVEVIRGNITNATVLWPLYCSFKVNGYKFRVESEYSYITSNGTRIEIVRGPLSKKIIKIRVPERELYIP